MDCLEHTNLPIGFVVCSIVLTTSISPSHKMSPEHALGDENWVQLYPFVKSFERGHTEERRDISDALALLVEGQKSES